MKIENWQTAIVAVALILAIGAIAVVGFLHAPDQTGQLIAALIGLLGMGGTGLTALMHRAAGRKGGSDAE